MAIADNGQLHSQEQSGNVISQDSSAAVDQQQVTSAENVELNVSLSTSPVPPSVSAGESTDGNTHDLQEAGQMSNQQHAGIGTNNPQQENLSCDSSDLNQINEVVVASVATLAALAARAVRDVIIERGTSLNIQGFEPSAETSSASATEPTIQTGAAVAVTDSHHLVASGSSPQSQGPRASAHQTTMQAQGSSSATTPPPSVQTSQQQEHAAPFQGASPLRRQSGHTNLLHPMRETASASPGWWQRLLVQLNLQHQALSHLQEQLHADCVQAQRYIRLMETARMRLLQARQQAFSILRPSPAETPPPAPAASHGSAADHGNSGGQSSSASESGNHGTVPSNEQNVTNNTRIRPIVPTSSCATGNSPIPHAPFIPYPYPLVPIPIQMASRPQVAPSTPHLYPLGMQPSTPNPPSSPAAVGSGDAPFNIGSQVPPGPSPFLNTEAMQLLSQFHPGHVLDGSIHHYIDLLRAQYVATAPASPHFGAQNSPSVYNTAATSSDCTLWSVPPAYLPLMASPQFWASVHPAPPSSPERAGGGFGNPFLDRMAADRFYHPSSTHGIPPGPMGTTWFNSPLYAYSSGEDYHVPETPLPHTPIRSLSPGYGSYRNCPAPPNTPASSVSSSCQLPSSSPGVSPSQLTQALLRVRAAMTRNEQSDSQGVRLENDQDESEDNYLAPLSIRTLQGRRRGPNHREPPPSDDSNGNGSNGSDDGRFRGGSDSSEEDINGVGFSRSSVINSKGQAATARRDCAGTCPFEKCEEPKRDSCGKGATNKPGSIPIYALDCVNKAQECRASSVCGAEKAQDPSEEDAIDAFAAAAKKIRKVKSSARMKGPFETVLVDSDADENNAMKRRRNSAPMASAGSPKECADDLDTLLKNLSLGYSEGASLRLPEGLVPTYTSSGGSYRPQQVPPADYCANVTTPPACVRDLQLDIPKTGEITVTDDVDDCVNEHCPTWINLDVTWNESGNFKINVERTPEPTCTDERNKSKGREKARMERDNALRKLRGLPEIGEGRSDAGEAESRKNKNNVPIQITRQLYGGAVLNESTFEKVRTRWYSVDPKKAFGCCDCSQVSDDDGPPVTAECLVTEEDASNRMLELNMTYLQAPPPLVPIHQIVEKLKGREPTGWSIEEVQELAEARLRSIRALRKDICEFGFEMRHSPGRSRQLTPHENHRLHYSARISGALGVLIDLVQAWQLLNIERLKYKTLIAGSSPRPGPGLNCGDAGFCLTARDYVNAEATKLANAALMCPKNDDDDDDDERNDNGDYGYEA